MGGEGCLTVVDGDGSSEEGTADDIVLDHVVHALPGILLPHCSEIESQPSSSFMTSPRTTSFQRTEEERILHQVRGDPRCLGMASWMSLRPKGGAWLRSFQSEAAIGCCQVARERRWRKRKKERNLQGLVCRKLARLEISRARFNQTSGACLHAYAADHLCITTPSPHRSRSLSLFFSPMALFCARDARTVLTCSKSTAGCGMRHGMLSSSHPHQVHAAPDKLPHRWVAKIRHHVGGLSSLV